MARLATVALLLAAVVAAGCGSDEPRTSTDTAGVSQGCDQGVGELSVDPAAAAPGETVGIEVANRSEDRVLTYGLANELERSEAGEWVPVELPPTPILEIALVVQPGETSGGGGGATRDRLELPRGLEPGHYRVVKQVTAGRPGGGGQTDSLTLCAALTVEG